MSTIMRSVIVKAAGAALVSLLVSLGISFVAVPLMGGQVEGAGLVMTIVLPVVIAFPAAGLQFWLLERSNRLRDELGYALLQLDDLNMRLSASNLELLAERSHDPLTRLLTPDVFRARLGEHVERPEIGQLIVFSIDGLDELRKSHGPMAADTAIFALSAAIRRSLRVDDFAGRMGDNEFAVFMPGSTPVLASLAVNSVTSFAAVVTLPYNGCSPMPTTASSGGVECGPGFDLGAAFKAAYDALALAVSEGGNCSRWAAIKPQTPRSLAAL